MVAEILPDISESVKSLTMIPSSGGRFEWTVDGELIYSKEQTGTFPDLNELKANIYAKIG